MDDIKVVVLLLALGKRLEEAILAGIKIGIKRKQNRANIDFV